MTSGCVPDATAARYVAPNAPGGPDGPGSTGTTVIWAPVFLLNASTMRWYASTWGSYFNPQSTPVWPVRSGSGGADAAEVRAPPAAVARCPAAAGRALATTAAVAVAPATTRNLRRDRSPGRSPAGSLESMPPLLQHVGCRADARLVTVAESPRNRVAMSRYDVRYLISRREPQRPARASAVGIWNMVMTAASKPGGTVPETPSPTTRTRPRWPPSRARRARSRCWPWTSASRSRPCSGTPGRDTSTATLDPFRSLVLDAAAPHVSAILLDRGYLERVGRRQPGRGGSTGLIVAVDDLVAARGQAGPGLDHRPRGGDAGRHAWCRCPEAAGHLAVGRRRREARPAGGDGRRVRGPGPRPGDAGAGRGHRPRRRPAGRAAGDRGRAAVGRRDARARRRTSTRRRCPSTAATRPRTWSGWRAR